MKRSLLTVLAAIASTSAFADVSASLAVAPRGFDSASFSVIARPGEAEQSFYQTDSVNGPKQAVDDLNASGRYDSQDSADAAFRFGSQRAANDRRGLGPRVRSNQKSQCRVGSIELKEISPLRRGRPCAS